MIEPIPSSWRYSAQSASFRMRCSVTPLQDAMLSNAVIVNGRAAEADGVDLIKSFIISPHKFSTFLMFDNVKPVAPALSYIVPYSVRKRKKKPS